MDAAKPQTACRAAPLDGAGSVAGSGAPARRPALRVSLKVVDPRMADRLPRRETDGSCGMDLRACLSEPIALKAGETRLIPTGIAIHIADPGYAAAIYPRSGMGHRRGLVLGNLVGIIDSDYQGELKVSLWNRSSADQTIEPFERIAQIVFFPVAQAQFDVVRDFSGDTDRGGGGFGSTGVD